MYKDKLYAVTQSHNLYATRSEAQDKLRSVLQEEQDEAKLKVEELAADIEALSKEMGGLW